MKYIHVALCHKLCADRSNQYHETIKSEGN